jgi:hypothetical protein
MAGYERDPNALAALLRMQPQIPQHTEEDQTLESMIPQEQLFQAQEAAGRRGAESGGAYAIPSRESLQQSGVAELRKLFGIQNAKAQAAALPARVTGEYGMANRRLQNQGALDVANVNEQGRSADLASNRQFQQQQQERGQTFQAGQGVLNREALAGRATQAQGATRSNAEYNQGQTNLRAEAKKPKGIGDFWNWLTSSGNEPEAAAAAPTATSPRVAAGIASLKQDPSTAGLTFEQIIQMGHGASLSPAELAELQAAW